MSIFALILIATFTLLEPNLSYADNTKEQRKLSVKELCLVPSTEKLKGKEVRVYGQVSSIGDKRRAFLGNRINQVVDIVLTPIKEDKTHPGCYVSCPVKVPGEVCQHVNGKLHCREITSPELKANLETISRLKGGETITVKGILKEIQIIPLHSIGGQSKYIANPILLECSILEIGK
ncbi:MAG: hypothetical protein KatS3mg078_1940 [Deltaproteobacteria bacterium]|nr:MAG: hypothetical protein KatS3mg078_1940 [Deltaproteobacteria bacterium]